MKGKVHLVGAGPGDPELITVKALRLIESCDAIVYDALAAPELVQRARRGCERIFVGKEPGKHTHPQDVIQRILVTLALDGKMVVRLKGGDPFVFGRGGEEAQCLAAHGIDFEVVPGVTAALAASAGAGMPLTHRDLASGVVFLSGHSRGDNEGAARPVNWRAFAQLGCTLCLYMATGNLQHICDELAAGGMAANTPTAVVQWAGTARQRVVTADLGSLYATSVREGITRPAIVIIGAVAALRDELATLAAAAEAETA